MQSPTNEPSPALDIGTSNALDQRPRMPASAVAKCNVCLRACHYHHYNVQSCEGCKQFFRRAICNTKYWICKGRNKNCEVTPVRNKCKGCRLDRCLQAGMDWRNLVNPREREHFSRLEIRELQVTAKNTLESNELQFLLRIVEAQSRILHAFEELNNEMASKFGNTIEQMLTHSDNLLGLADSFSLQPWPISHEEMSKVYAETEMLGFMQPFIAKCMKVDALLCVGVVKAMPSFERLSLSDKIRIARHARLPYNILVNSYCALELGSNTWQRRSMVSPMVASFRVGKFYEDKKLDTLSKNNFTNSVIPFTNAAISKEEFALLLAILISQTTDIPDLSAEARELLGSESARYSKILLRHLQCRLGSMEAGAKRFAECIHLVNHCFQHVHHSQLFFTYTETFYMRQCAPMKQEDKSDFLYIM